MPPARIALLLLATSFTLLGTGCVAVAVHAARVGIENMSHPECEGYDAARSAADRLGTEAKRLKAAGRISAIAMIEAQQEAEIHKLRLKSLCEALRDNDITQQKYREGFDKTDAAFRNARADLEAGSKAVRAAAQAASEAN